MLSKRFFERNAVAAYYRIIFLRTCLRTKNWEKKTTIKSLALKNLRQVLIQNKR